MNETKTCPFCAEEIKAAAIKCKHCGEMLTVPPEPATQLLPPAKSGRTLRTILIVFGVTAAIFVIALLIVIFAAIAIPQLVKASDRGRQRQSMDYMRNIAAANGTMRVDTGHYAAELGDLRDGGYMDEVPLLDAWGNPFVYVTGVDTYTLSSLGSDGAVGPDPPVPWLDKPYEPDMVVTDGQFVQAPTGR